MILWRLSSDIEQPHYCNDPGHVRRYAGSLGMRHALTRAYGWAISAQAMGGITSELSRSGSTGEAKLVAARNISIGEPPGLGDLKFGHRLGASGARSEWQLGATPGVHLHAHLLWLGQSFISHAGPSGSSPAFWRIKSDTDLVYRINER